jgi:hypothetical protein
MRRSGLPAELDDLKITGRHTSCTVGWRSSGSITDADWLTLAAGSRSRDELLCVNGLLGVVAGR